MIEETEPVVTPWELLGGAPAVKLMVGRIYHLIKFDDEIYLRYFDGIDLVRIQAHMVALLTKLLGGPDKYQGRDLREAHRDLRIPERHYVRVGNYVMSALYSVHPTPEIVRAVADALDEAGSVIITARL
jgi:hemoglobin